MKNLSGWQIVALVVALLGALVALVALGQQVSALVGAGLLVASAMGIPIYQQAVNGEKMTQVKELANGNLRRLQDQITDLQAQFGAERADMLRQLAESHQRSVALATLLPPDTKIPDQIMPPD